VTHLPSQLRIVLCVTSTRRYRQTSAPADRRHLSGRQRHGLLFLRDAAAVHDSCGNSGCRRARDPDGRHGSYYHPGHMKGGRLVYRRLTREQARIVRRAKGQEAHEGLGGRNRTSSWTTKQSSFYKTMENYENSAGDLRYIGATGSFTS
jgi:hypothetical protein